VRGTSARQHPPSTHRPFRGLTEHPGPVEHADRLTGTARAVRAASEAGVPLAPGAGLEAYTPVPQPPISSAPPRTLSPSRPQPAPLPPLSSRGPSCPSPSRPHPQPSAQRPPPRLLSPLSSCPPQEPHRAPRVGSTSRPSRARPPPGLDPAGGEHRGARAGPAAVPHGPAPSGECTAQRASWFSRAPGQPPCWALRIARPRTGGPVVGPPPLPHSCPSPTLTLGARPPGASWLMSLNLCRGPPGGEWKELFKEAVAERRPGARALPPRAFHRATQNAAAARRRRASKQRKKGTPPKPYATSSQPPWPARRRHLAALRCRHPPLQPSRSDSRTTPRPHPYPFPCRRSGTRGVPSARHLKGTFWGPLVSTWDRFGMEP